MEQARLDNSLAADKEEKTTIKALGKYNFSVIHNDLSLQGVKNYFTSRLSCVYQESLQG